MSNLSDIGFPTPDDQAINDMITHVLELVEPIKCSHGFYLKYHDASGAELWLQGNFNQELIGFNPHFAGKSRRKVGVAKKIERDSSDLDGGFYAWADPSDKDVATSGLYPFIFDVPDFCMFEVSELPVIKEIQLTAFASNDFEVFESEKDFERSQEDSDKKFSSRYFVASGLDDIENENWDKDAPPRPIAMFAGHIKELETRTNEISGEVFYWFLVDTLGGEVDVVADAKFILSEPKIGGIVSGQFWLSGRLL